MPVKYICALLFCGDLEAAYSRGLSLGLFFVWNDHDLFLLATPKIRRMRFNPSLFLPSDNARLNRIRVPMLLICRDQGRTSHQATPLSARLNAVCDEFLPSCMLPGENRNKRLLSTLQTRLPSYFRVSKKIQTDSVFHIYLLSPL